MDSPHLLLLGLLILDLAAPHPSIAMSTVVPVEGTEDSSPGSTTVTVYHCKDCKSSTCKSRAKSFENFQKIAETQNKTFSDVKIELVANETHVTVCFERANSCIEGIYGIFWRKAGGAGLSCGILNSGENGRGNISTEKNVCCEAETDIWRNNPSLKCYIQKSHPKPKALPASIPEGLPGNPEFLTSKKNSIGILFTFVVVAVCSGWATTHYFLRLRCHRGFRQGRQVPDREIQTHLCEPSTSEKICPPAASSSSPMMYSNQLNTD